ncbi:uncharacterized protein LOC111705349 [Eurytemora carolleeae]|uniref:uncharacterized protein LOC111705349 n=1 Tax=Eurytemora carolleeae TaxID=1294199 RepID=UPI000C780B46|nr:uncharacterized protein LOC111705349 [Eurytemora carolleeae]|eukprot:XP_023333624.1 uncharacterized protein LOC111705349 [Eurytemora affinis]
MKLRSPFMLTCIFAFGLINPVVAVPVDPTETSLDILGSTISEESLVPKSRKKRSFAGIFGGPFTSLLAVQLFPIPILPTNFIGVQLTVSPPEPAASRSSSFQQKSGKPILVPYLRKSRNGGKTVHNINRFQITQQQPLRRSFPPYPLRYYQTNFL